MVHDSLIVNNTHSKVHVWKTFGMQMAGLEWMFRQPVTQSEWETYIAVLECHKTEYEGIMSKENREYYEVSKALQQADKSNAAKVKELEDEMQRHIQKIEQVRQAYELVVTDLGKARSNLARLKAQEVEGKK